MELTIYALIYWNDNFKSEVKKMLGLTDTLVTC